jgi:CRISPR/Cas system-associated endonuclease Cas3-HD
MEPSNYRDSINNLYSFMHNLERSQREQFGKIIEILGKHAKKILEIEMECYKIERVIQYESETVSIDTKSLRQSMGQEREQ